MVALRFANAPITGFEIATKRALRFTRALLIDAAGDKIGAALCDIRWLPQAGIASFDEFKITCVRDSDGDVAIHIEQDPLTDLVLIRSGLGSLRAGSTVTVQPQ